MKISIKLFLIFFLFIILDKIWFSFSASFFKSQIGSMMNMDGEEIKLRIAPAILVYVLMSIGLYYFVFFIKEPVNISEAILRGGVLGFTIYGVFDLTNRALLKHYPWEMVIVDMIWGTVIFSLISMILYFINSLNFL